MRVEVTADDVQAMQGEGDNDMSRILAILRPVTVPVILVGIVLVILVEGIWALGCMAVDGFRAGYRYGTGQLEPGESDPRD